MLEKVELGLSGLSVSPLCFGTGTNGYNNRSNQSDLGLERLSDLLCYAYDRGIRFWDTADGYGTHPHIAHAHQRVGRENVTLTTKTTSREPQAVRDDIERYLSELKTDYLDIVLLHCQTQADWPERDIAAMDVLSEYKDRGIIRALGVSCHDFGAFSSAADSDWVDVVLARINYAGHAMDDTPEKVAAVIGRMAAAGKGIYAMKVVGGGTELTKDPRKAIHYSFAVDGVHAMVLGMMDEQQIDENIGYLEEVLVPA
ncbi:MAG: aryl-alcohol dehydrogenase-like predicted oxidoreductase [Candidatus Latescibacterota bacterium]|jgi:1-deoxyxylulose-5-phosphate synthase